MILAMIAAAALTLGERADTNIYLYVYAGASDAIVSIPNDLARAETVRTVTNVVEEFFCPRCYVEPGQISIIGQHQVWRQDGDCLYVVDEPCPKTIKRVTTIVKRIYTLTITYRGKKRKLVHEEIVSETVQQYVKKETWEVVKEDE